MSNDLNGFALYPPPEVGGFTVTTNKIFIKILTIMVCVKNIIVEQNGCR